MFYHSAPDHLPRSYAGLKYPVARCIDSNRIERFELFERFEQFLGSGLLRQLLERELIVGVHADARRRAHRLFRDGVGV